MTFKTEKRLLNVVSQVFASEINEVYICKDVKEPGNIYYTIILIKQRRIAGAIMKPGKQRQPCIRNIFRYRDPSVWCFPMRANVH